MKLEAAQFIHFTEALQGQPVVRQALERLQSQHHFRASILMYLIWSAHAGQPRMRKASYPLVDKAITAWHEQVVRHLESLGELLSADKCKQLDVRQDIAELMSEAQQFEWRLIFDASGPHRQRERNVAQQVKDACHNVLSYFQYCKVNLNQGALFDVQSMLHSAFHQLPRQEIGSILELTRARLDMHEYPGQQLVINY